jgi:hypothetical protein
MKEMAILIVLSLLISTGCTKINESLMGSTYDSQSDVEQQIGYASEL